MADLFRQQFIEPAVVDEQIALAARSYMRDFPECKKPNDAIHLATALDLNVDELHTFDGSDLLGLSGRIQRRDGQPLTICKPTPLPTLKAPPKMADLFDSSEQRHQR